MEHQLALVDLRGKKRRALLIYLVLAEGRSVHRDDLTELFWPNSASHKARASLRQALTDLRKVLGPSVILADGESVSVDARRVKTDLDEMIVALSAPDLAESVDLRQLGSFAGLLRAFDGISDAFDDWLQILRTQWSDRIIEAAAVQLQDSAVPTTAKLQLARALLNLDPLNEIAVRAQMGALADLSDNAAALRVYHGFFERIEEELAVEPSIETQELAVQIKSQIPPEEAGILSASPAYGSARPLTLVAVMPFERLGATEIPDYRILGILDQVTCKMARFRSPAVVSSNSTRQFMGQSLSPVEVAQRLDARYVVSGSISGTPPSCILAVQLCDGADGRVHWAKTISLLEPDATAQSLKLAEEIACAIEPSLNHAELERARTVPLGALEPHHLVLQAKDRMFHLTHQEFSEARALLDQAMEVGASFAPAFALSAEWYAINIWQGWSQHREQESAKLLDHARRAMQYSPGDGRALAQWAHYKITLDRDFDEALALLEEAQTLAPSDSETLIWTVPTFAHSGQAARALRNGKEALRLSPFDPFQFRNEHFLSLAHYANDDFEAAARLGLACHSKVPAYGSNLRVTIAALQAADRTSEAAELAKYHAELEPQYSLARVHTRMGFRDPATQDVYVSRLMKAGVSA